MQRWARSCRKHSPTLSLLSSSFRMSARNLLEAACEVICMPQRWGWTIWDDSHQHATCGPAVTDEGPPTPSRSKGRIQYQQSLQVRGRELGLCGAMIYASLPAAWGYECSAARHTSAEQLCLGCADSSPRHPHRSVALKWVTAEALCLGGTGCAIQSVYVRDAVCIAADPLGARQWSEA